MATANDCHEPAESSTKVQFGLIAADNQWRIAQGCLHHDFPGFSIQNIHVGTDKVGLRDRILCAGEVTAMQVDV